MPDEVERHDVGRCRSGERTFLKSVEEGCERKLAGRRDTTLSAGLPTMGWHSRLKGQRQLRRGEFCRQNGVPPHKHQELRPVGVDHGLSVRDRASRVLKTDSVPGSRSLESRGFEFVLLTKMSLA